MTDISQPITLSAQRILRLPLLRRWIGGRIAAMIPDIGQAAMMAYVAPFQIGRVAAPAAEPLPDGRDPRW